MLNSAKEKLSNPDSFVSLAIGLAVVLVIGAMIFNFTKQKGQESQKQTEAELQAQEEGLLVALPAKHKVQEGETLWVIAEKYYKSGYNWKDVADANNLADPNDIKTGQELTIPKAEPLLAKAADGEIISAATDTKPKQDTYTVIKGDNLWKIAEDQYGTGYQWTNIAKANNLANPSIIHAGNVLKLP